MIPFVPLADMTMAQAVSLAVETGERIWRELGVPVFLYEEAARRPERRALPHVRNQGFEALSRRVAEEAWKPDLGDRLHVSAGAVCVGARFFLVAFNVDLESEDLAVAQAIAKEVRESSGGLPAVRAKGFRLASQKRVQVSLNLVDHRVTGIARAFLEVSRRAEARGVRVARTELVGLVPEAALEAAAVAMLRLEGAGERVLERRLAALPATPDQFARYLEAIAAPGHAPGGGSAGAMAAALGHACLEKARALSPGKLDSLGDSLGKPARWLALAAEDGRAFAELADTWSLPKGDPRKRVAADASVRVALEVARAAVALAEGAARVARDGNKNLVNDAALAAELALAAVRGARWNALGTRRKDATLRAEVNALLARAEAAAVTAREAAEPR